MNATEKIDRIKHLEILIKEKESELNLLKAEYNKTKEPELPILLFCINTTRSFPKDIRDYKYTYYYYCPDLDEVLIINKNGFFREELLPDTLDFRQLFGKLVFLPLEVNITLKIRKAVKFLKAEIDSLFSNNNIDSWSELGNCLLDKCFDKGKPRLLNFK